VKTISEETLVERLREHYANLAGIGRFPPPPAGADMSALMRYREEHRELIAEADILNELGLEKTWSE
jgi:hypothetical protein